MNNITEQSQSSLLDQPNNVLGVGQSISSDYSMAIQFTLHCVCINDKVMTQAPAKHCDYTKRWISEALSAQHALPSEQSGGWL